MKIISWIRCGGNSIFSNNNFSAKNEIRNLPLNPPGICRSHGTIASLMRDMRTKIQNIDNRSAKQDDDGDWAEREKGRKEGTGVTWSTEGNEKSRLEKQREKESGIQDLKPTPGWWEQKLETHTVHPRDTIAHWLRSADSCHWDRSFPSGRSGT